jgi:hypothetical protein
LLVEEREGEGGKRKAEEVEGREGEGGRRKAEEEAGWGLGGCGEPGQELSMCLSTCQGFMRDQQMGQATRPSSGGGG